MVAVTPVGRRMLHESTVVDSTMPRLPANSPFVISTLDCGAIFVISAVTCVADLAADLDDFEPLEEDVDDEDDDDDDDEAAAAAAAALSSIALFAAAAFLREAINCMSVSR